MKHIQKGENILIIKVRLLLLHIGALVVFVIPFDLSLLYLLLITYFIRMFGMEGGYHQYFSHKSFKTSRLFQFILALIATSSGQRGVLWWAQKHRLHHKLSDTENDLHTPKYNSFWYSHIAWLWNKNNLDTELDKVKDLAKYPELLLLNKYHFVPPILFIVLLFIIGEYTNIISDNIDGIQAVVWGFFVSTVLIFHFTLSINSVVHTRYGGNRRFETNDNSKNNIILAIPTMGASWHNNHHRIASTAKAGFYWWEIDLTFYILKLLSIFNIVWELKPVPPKIYYEAKKSTTIPENRPR
jgi:stearoyl-CoA desaturase (delta-9 desaturase)